MKSAVGLLLVLIYSTIIKILLLCQVGIQESSCEDNAKLNSLGVIWESKRSWRAHFQAFGEPKIQNFPKHGATSRIYWVRYKPPVLSFWEVGLYACVTTTGKVLSCMIKVWDIGTVNTLKPKKSNTKITFYCRCYWNIHLDTERSLAAKLDMVKL